MRVLVTGAYGLIGSAVLARLHRDRHSLVAAGRSIAEAQRRYGYAQWIEADFAQLSTPDAWRPLLAGIDAVVNCVGVLQDSIRDDAEFVHIRATCSLFDACAQAGIRRIVHLSAIGVERRGPTAFSRTKAEADRHLAEIDIDWTILRPGLVLGATVYGGSAMLRGIAGLPFVLPLAAADSRIQVVSLDDIAATVSHCLAAHASSRVTWELVHPDIHSLRDIVVEIRQWLGYPWRPVIRVPTAVARIVMLAADALGWLGWRSPARSTAMAQLAHGVVGNPSAWILATGIQPKALDDILAAAPASVADRWFARLYWLKPIAILTLALFWFVTGALALGPGWSAAMNRLAAAGFIPELAKFTLLAGSIFDIVLGALLLVRRFSRPVLLIMLAATPIYLLVGTVTAPEYWVDPLGPYTKIAPILLATAFTLAILDER
jgi:uncharacterized protein YbjT (DUF2867 family)